ncbi:MAG: hypothetical protein JSV64_04300 [Candidatus Bathyarchaeota archaeon]|nr:MAG: hypothetical protein JSV64_04300 [Candidatus Bathyarchaeota archaeon]
MRRIEEKYLSLLVKLAVFLLCTAATMRTLNTCVSLDAARHGPREDDLVIRYYPDSQTAYMALKNDEIDLLDWDVTIKPPSPPDPSPNGVEDFIWVTNSISPDGLANWGLPGHTTVPVDAGAYNGYGLPNWTGNFTVDHPLASVNSITVHALPFTPDSYTYALTEGVDFVVHADDDLIELLNPLDVQIINEHWKEGVNNTLNGWPWIRYVASCIQSVYVDFNNGTARWATNNGFEVPPPSEWWYEPDWPGELEGWWALGYFAGPWAWPAGSEWWVNYTAASHISVDYNAEPILTWPADFFTDAVEDPCLVLDAVADFGFYEIDLNNNYTIGSYPGVRSPMNYTEMRQAIAWLTDKEYVVSEICGGFAERIDQMIAAPLKGWADETNWYPNYPYEYNPPAAAVLLNSKFPQGATINPYYDSAFPGSAEYIRTYPLDHPQKAEQNLDPLIVVVRDDDQRRLQTGRLIYSNMRKHGIPCIVIEGSAPAVYDRVMGDFDYHFYTGGWKVGRFPAVTLYGLYHSDFTYPHGQNYVTGNLTHPTLDALLEAGNYALTYLDAITATKSAGGWMTEYCVNVPLWSNAGYYAWRSSLLGVVNMEGSGPINDYTFLNAYKIDGSPIRVGLTDAPHSMNIVYSSWQVDYRCLDRMNLYGGQEVAPYDLAADQNGFVKYHEITTWSDPDDGGAIKSKIVETYRTNGYYCEPVTGNQKAVVNAYDYMWNAWYDYQLNYAWFSSSFFDLHHINVLNSTTLEIYFDTLSYWNNYDCQGPLRPRNIWFAEPSLVGSAIETFTEGPGNDFEAPDIVPLANEPIFIDWVEVNDVPLTPNIDYNIYARGGGPNAYLEILTSIADGSTVDVSYRYPMDPRGYTPGNVAWQTILEGGGMYYATSFTPGVGGSITLKKNPFYYQETPPLGEIDFIRKPSGEYEVDIFDIIDVAGAFGSQGKGIPDANWLAGADLFPPGGIIDDFDVAVVHVAMGTPMENHDVAVLALEPSQTEVTVGDLVLVNVTLENQGDYTETFEVTLRLSCSGTEVDSQNVTLASMETTTITMVWNTTGFEGYHTISAYAGPVYYGDSFPEHNLWDNFLFGDLIHVKPVFHTVVVETAGQKYNMTVESDGILTHIVATKNSLHLDVSGPPGQTAYVNATIPTGLNTTSIKVFVDNVKLEYPPFPIITSNGTHYFVYFETTLSIHGVTFKYALPDVVVANISSSREIVGQGYIVVMNVTVQNLATESRMCNVSMFADCHQIFLGDEIIVGIQNLTIAGESNTTVTFVWNTTGVDKGFWALCAVVDDAQVHGPILVTLAGDVDGDRDVDIFDIVRMAGVYGVAKPDPDYDPIIDLDGDGDIDIFDLVRAAGNYGESW